MSLLRYTECCENPHYANLMAAAVQRLVDVGMFAKAEVMADTSLHVFDENAFRWDYLRRMIEEAHDTALIPLAKAAFPHIYGGPQKELNLGGIQAPPDKVASKHIANGYGKRCIGFAIADQRNSHLIIKQLHTARRRVQGMVEKMNDTVRVAQNANVGGLAKIERQQLFPTRMPELGED